MAYPKHIRPLEQPIIDRVIRKALDQGHSISVSDGLSWALTRSRDYDAITAEVHATDITEFVIRNSDKKKLGWILFIHGNDEDVISDTSDNTEIEELCRA
jgi:hypothetical protein